MPYFPLVFGRGVERASGATVVDPDQMQVAENVFLSRGKVEPRTGLYEQSDLTGDYIAMIQASRVKNEGVEVVVTGTSVSIKRTDGSALTPVNLGVWLNPHLTDDSKFRAIGAESGGKVFLAHEERTFAKRGHTVYYDPVADPNTFFPLIADWAVGGLDPMDPVNERIKFRGVTAWLDYLVGWGFGTNDSEQPELIRISNPGAPTEFEEYAWLRAGQQGDPVQACLAVPGGLLVYKEAETYMVTGSDRASFGIDLSDALFGLAAPRLAVAVGGTVYGWSLEGPRRNRSGASEDIAWPLGLPWPTAEDIATSGRILGGFASYMPERRLILFTFEDWVYSYSPEQNEWNHWRMGRKAWAGGILYPAGGFIGSSRGYPSYVQGVVPNLDDTIYATYQNNLQEGDETVEVYYRVLGSVGAWTAGPTQAVGSTPSFTISGLLPGVSYQVAFRYLRSGVASPGYDDPSPSAWPLVSRGTETTVPPAITDLAGAHVHEGDTGTNTVTLTWTPPDPTATYVVLRDGVPITGSPFIAGTATVDDIWVDGDRPYLDEYTYTVQAVYTHVTVEAEVDVAITSAMPLILSLGPQDVGSNVLEGSVDATEDPVLTTEIEIATRERNYTGSLGGALYDWLTVQTLAVPSSAVIPFSLTQRGPGPGHDGYVEIDVRTRYRYNAGAYYGPWLDPIETFVMEYGTGMP